MSLHHSTALLGLIVAIAVGLGCKAPDPTEMVIVVTTNIAPGTVLLRVHVVAQRVGATTADLDKYYLLAAVGQGDGGAHDAGADGGPMTYTLPGEISIVAANADDTRPLDVKVTAELASTDQNFTVESIVNFTPHFLTFVDVFLAAQCTVPAIREACGPTETCGANGCEPIARPTSRTPPVSADVTFIDDLPPPGIDASVDVNTADVPGDNGCPTIDLDIGTPRLLSPLSGSTVTGPGATLAWDLPSTATYSTIEICFERTCSMLVLGDSSGMHTTGNPYSFQLAPLGLLPGVYFWRAVAYNGACQGTYSPVWEFVVPHFATATDGGAPRAVTSYGATPDFNGDGFADLAVGSIGVAGMSSPGSLDVYNGSSEGIAVSAVGTHIPPPSSLTGLGATFFGGQVASAGDLNGDGFVDLAVGTQCMVAFVYAGSASGVGTTPTAILAPTNMGAPVGGLGSSMTGAGDLNGDGYGDLAVGASDSNVVVVFLGAASLTGAPRTRVLTGASPTNHAGAAVAAGDIDGDGFSDLVVGATGATSGPIGQVYVYYGAIDGPLSTAYTLPSPSVPVTISQSFGDALAVGDFNGDGYVDIAVGDPMSALVAFYLGGSRTPTCVGTVHQGTGGAGQFGAEMSGAGDLDGDGYGDILVGAPTASAAYVLLGANVTPFAPTVVPFQAGAIGAGFGYAVAGIGDVNNDGLSDAVVSSINASRVAMSTVALYRTGPPVAWRTPTVEVLPTVIDGPTPRTAFFGYALGHGR